MPLGLKGLKSLLEVLIVLISMCYCDLHTLDFKLQTPINLSVKTLVSVMTSPSVMCFGHVLLCLQLGTIILISEVNVVSRCRLACNYASRRSRTRDTVKLTVCLYVCVCMCVCVSCNCSTVTKLTGSIGF